MAPSAPDRDTWPEEVVADWLRRHGIAFEPQYPLLSGRSVDFWLPRQRVAIECQGDWYHGGPVHARPQGLNRGQRRRQSADAALHRWCDRYHIPLVVVWECDLRRHPERVWQALLEAVR